MPTLVSITLLFFVGGWYRGAYPWMGRLHPGLARAPPGIPVPAEEEVEDIDIPEQLIRVHGLKEERKRIKEKLKLTERMVKAASGSMSAYYSRQQKVLVEDLADINRQLADIQAGGPSDVEVPGGSEVESPELVSGPTPEQEDEPVSEPEAEPSPEEGS